MPRRPFLNACDQPAPSEITPHALYESRRDWLRGLALGAAGAGLAQECANLQALLS